MSANYVSGVTNFASYVSTTTAGYTCCFPELGGVGGMPAWNTVDLGSVVNITRMVVWNQAGSASLNTFGLESDVGSLGSYAMDPNSQDSPQPPSVFSFSAVNTRYITMNITSNFGYQDGTMLNEVAFEGGSVSVVPEPASVVLVATGLLGVFGVARRRQRRA